MRGFDMHEVGKLVRNLRNQRGLTQAVLAEQAGIDIATLSKIENGHSMPKQGTLKSLLEKLRFDFVDTMPLFLSEKEARFNELKQKVVGLGDIQNPENLEKLNSFLDEAEKDAELCEDDLSRQYILNVRASILKFPANMAINTSWSREGLTEEEVIKEKKLFSFSTEVAAKLDKSIELSYKAMKITIPAFDIEKIEEYYLSVTELEIIRNLGNAYYIKGENELAIDIYIRLEKSINSSYRGKAFVSANYQNTIANLCNHLIYSYRYEDVVEYANKGLEKCIKLNLPMIPILAFFKGLAMLKIIHKEKGTFDVPEASEAKMILRDAYHGCRLIGRISTQRHIEDIFAKWFKTKVDGTPIEDMRVNNNN